VVEGCVVASSRHVPVVTCVNRAYQHAASSVGQHPLGEHEKVVARKVGCGGVLSLPASVIAFVSRYGARSGGG